MYQMEQKLEKNHKYDVLCYTNISYIFRIS
jgi:hypothetical protein